MKKSEGFKGLLFLKFISSIGMRLGIITMIFSFYFLFIEAETLIIFVIFFSVGFVVALFSSIIWWSVLRR